MTQHDRPAPDARAGLPPADTALPDTDETDVCVFAPGLLLTITVECGADDEDELHLHAGGQGFWLARMLVRLGHRPVVTTVLGGETGVVVDRLVRQEGIVVDAVSVDAATAAYVHDRRADRRHEITRTREPRLTRHERDDLYGTTLAHAIRTGVCVVTGRPAGSAVDLDLYRRLAADLAAAQVTVVGDLHGDELTAFLEGGPMAVLKASDEDLADDGRLAAEVDDGEAIGVMQDLAGDRIGLLVVSRTEHPSLALSGGQLHRLQVPPLQEADHRGAGDSMTAALVAATLRGWDVEDALRLAGAAGAANVTRHGLATADPALIIQLAAHASVTTSTSGVGVREEVRDG